MPCDDPHTLGELLRKDVQEAFEVRPHVLGTDAGGGHDDPHPVDVIGEESRAGRQDGGREVGEVVLGILDAFLPPPLAIAVPKLGVKRILPLDNGRREGSAAGVDGPANGDIGIIHGN